MNKKISVIITSGGSSTRFGSNKLLEKLGDLSVIETTISKFLEVVDEIIIPTKEDIKSHLLNSKIYSNKIKFTQAGATRQNSVYNGLLACDNPSIVLIHDGARPFITRQAIEGCIESVKTHGSGICAVECRDTIAVEENGQIVAVPTRANLRQIQTPQGFYREKILLAYEHAFLQDNPNYTDDSSVYAAFCEKPYLCAGDPENVKMTYAEDFAKTARCGFGVDTHAFGKAQDFIVLAGVKVPSQSGLIAHSDGDVLVHAVMDAMLSAAGLKDIGHYFPDTDEQWKGASSMKMLEMVTALLSEQGFAVQNLSVAIQAERPRLAKYIDEMKTALSGVLRIDPTRIGISAGTNEGLGYVGEGKGITVNAFVLLQSK